MAIKIDQIKGNLTVVMYHYVREIKESLYPGIKGLEFEKFKTQLDHLQSKYQIIQAEDVISSCLNGSPIPENSCLLTFDDGYKDHIKFVLPELKSRRIQGTFFPPAKAILDRELLDVNAIHFILERCTDYKLLLKELFDLCISRDNKEELLGEWKVAYGSTGKWDSEPEPALIKRLLQFLLPERIRADITSILFEKYVGQKQRDFADDLYLTTDDLKIMLADGMYIGSHGYKHFWLDRCSVDDQKEEIINSLKFLTQIGASTKDWMMCYPHGAYNNDTVKLLDEYNCGIAFKDSGGETILDIDRRYDLARYDTNDFPQ